MELKQRSEVGRIEVSADDKRDVLNVFKNLFGSLCDADHFARLAEFSRYGTFHEGRTCMLCVQV